MTTILRMRDFRKQFHNREMQQHASMFVPLPRDGAWTTDANFATP
ncbi:hypothetical protein [Rudaea sp.]